MGIISSKKSQAASNSSKSTDIFPHVYIKNDCYGEEVWDSNNKCFVFIKYGQRAEIIGIKNNKEDNSEIVIVKFLSGSTEKVIELPRESAAACNPKELGKYGIDVNISSNKVLSKLFSNQMASLSLINYHTTLGFKNEKINGAIQKIFYGPKAITADNSCSSEFSGDLKIIPNGSEDEYYELIRNDVLGNTALEAAFVFGCSAPVLAYLNDELTGESLYIHMVGITSTGKSTALKLAISTAGDPGRAGNTLFKTFNATKNALISALKQNFGYPIAFDELGESTCASLSDVLMSIINSSEKSRCHSDGKLKDLDSWCTTIISSGNISIFSKLSSNAAMAARILEFTNKKWTNDATQAERINSVVRKNYGFSVPKIAQYLLQSETDEIADIFHK